MADCPKWKIIGGAASGGLLVRQGQGTDSAQCEQRLSTGAVVEELALKGDRLHYKLVSGDGPAEGWISLKMKNKALAELLEEEPGGTAWSAWKPMSAARWQKWPKAGQGAKPQNMKKLKEVMNDVEEGEFWGIKFPHSPTMLKEWGPSWLTEAMHKVGTLPKDNEIVEFTSFVVVGEDVSTSKAGEGNNNADWGGAGPKVLLSVKYKNGPGELTEDMFVKFPHEFHPKNERFKLSVGMQGQPPSGFSECMFYNTVGGRMPFRTPRGYFGEMSRRTTNYILITERVAYGSKTKPIKDFAANEILPAPAKYRDWELQNAVDYYFAHARTMASYFSWSRKMNKTTDQIFKCFADDGMLGLLQGIADKVGPMSWADRDKGYPKLLQELGQVAGSMTFGPDIAKGFLALAQDFFTTKGGHLLPKECNDKAYLDKFFKEATELSQYCVEMTFYNFIMPEFLALGHPNAQVDNAYYWRNDSGDMVSGILDWDGAGFQPMPTVLSNAWMGAEPDMLDEHEESIVRCFLDEYKTLSGDSFEFDLFYMCFKISQACVMYGCFANIGQLHRMGITPEEWSKIKDRRDPKIDQQFLIRCYYVQAEMFVASWKKRSAYPHWQKFMRQTGLPKK